MTQDIISHRLGTVTLAPSGPVVAGSIGQWTLVYTVGSYGIDEGGTLKLSQRFASDWQTPQFDQPTEPAFTTVTTNGPAKLRPYYHKKAHERPWMKCLVIDVYDGNPFARRDRHHHAGRARARSHPASGPKPFRSLAHEFRLLIDPTNASLARRLPTSPKFPVVAGPPVEMVCLVPSQVEVGQTIEIFVKGQDVWGNPTPPPAGLDLGWLGRPDVLLEGSNLTLQSPGSGYVIATAHGDSGQFTCRSNPITAFADSPPLKKYWGDLHAQSDATVGTGNEAEYFTFGRDFARLDFASHQGNDFQMTDEDWQRLNNVVSDFHRDGSFVVFPAMSGRPIPQPAATAMFFIWKRASRFSAPAIGKSPKHRKMSEPDSPGQPTLCPRPPARRPKQSAVGGPRGGSLCRYSPIF